MYPTMCNFCYPILGYTKPHSESDCALKQATVCPTCGPCTHFHKSCPKRPRRIPAGFQAISSIEQSQQSESSPVYLLAHSNSVYTEYLKLYKLEISAGTGLPALEKNRKTVEIHLQKRGYILQNPLETPKLLERTETVCKEIHGGNNCCAIVRVDESCSGKLTKRRN
jgi:hypothetical protein